MCFHGDLRFISFSVRCPRDFGQVYPMKIRLLYTRENSWFPAPCCGCDWKSGSPVCIRCVSALTSMFFRDPDIDVSLPLTPSLPEC